MAQPIGGNQSLAKFLIHGFLVPSPIIRIYAGFNITVKCGMRPIGNAVYMPMLDRIVMDVIHVPAIVFLIPQCMFPVAALPDPAFIF